MKALFNHELYVIVEVYDQTIELERLDNDERVHVSLADARLIVDPTDGDLDEAEALRLGGLVCPHCTSVIRHGTAS